jgi:hypothetical protein
MSTVTRGAETQRASTAGEQEPAYGEICCEIEPVSSLGHGARGRTLVLHADWSA